MRLLWILLLLWLASPARAWDPLQKDRRAAEEAGEHLAAGEAQEAVEAYARAQALNPDEPLYRMGLGEALFEAGDLEGAASQFLAAADPERPGLTARALYNAGNAYLEAGDARKALSLYQRALLSAEPDEDLLHNLELAQRRLEESRQQDQQQEQPQDQKGDEQEEQDQQDQKDPQDRQDQQDQEKPQDQEQDQQQQDQQQQDQPPQDQEQEPSAPPDSLPQPPPPDSTATAPPESLAALPQGMTPEEAMRLLEALDHDEEELRRSIQRRLRGAETESEHEW